jgi:two-component system, cell cycle sensor histidine kinase and response regulator CckA
MGVAIPAPRREERLLAFARAMRSLAEVRSAERVLTAGAAAARAVTGARAAAVVLTRPGGPQGAIDGDGPWPAAPLWDALAAGASPAAVLGLATSTAIIAVALGDGRGWLYAIAPANDGSDDRELLAAVAAQIVAADDLIAAHRGARATESKYRALVEQLPAVTYYRPLDAPGQASFVSPQVEDVIGYTAAEMIADPGLWRSLLHPDDRDAVLRGQSEFKPGAERRPVMSEYRMIARDGRVVWVRNYALAVRDDSGTPRFILGVLFDVTASRRAEAARLSSEAKLRHVADANVIGLLTVDAAGVVTEANDAVLTMLGYRAEDVAAGTLRWADLSPPEGAGARAAFLAQLREHGRTPAVEKLYVRKDGGRVPVLVGAARVPGGDDVVAFVLDLSERKRLEERLQQSQKMDAIGQLAGGVAHDFNNVLSVILSYGELLMRQLRPGDPLRDDVAEIVTAGERASALTRQLLAFSRRQVLQPRVVDLGDVVAGLEAMLRRLLGEDIALDSGRPGEAYRARVDPAQIEQVILNLAVNARDAMPEGGLLVIQVDGVELADPHRVGIELPPGEYVRLTVTDTGQGMDGATRARMFEPFFTTKPMGRGTGLGLATVFGIVEQSGGGIAVESAPGQGTSIAVYLPRTEAPPTAVTTQPPTQLRGSEIVLLTEDDDAVRRLMRSALRQYGYQVLEAANGGEAILLSEQHAGTIDLLVTDVVLPRMSGRHLAERLAAQRPTMRILFMTGYTDDAIVRHGVERSEVSLLQKPFTADELVARVRQILDGAEPPAPIR